MVLGQNNHPKNSPRFSKSQIWVPMGVFHAKKSSNFENLDFLKIRIFGAFRPKMALWAHKFMFSGIWVNSMGDCVPENRFE